MIYALPVVGWIIGFFLHTMLAIPFYFFWNWEAPIYFYWLPAVYQSLPFWNIVWLFGTITILKMILLPSFHSPVLPWKKDKNA